MDEGYEDEAAQPMPNLKDIIPLKYDDLEAGEDIQAHR